MTFRGIFEPIRDAEKSRRTGGEMAESLQTTDLSTGRAGVRGEYRMEV